MADLLFEVENHIATITLNRPEAYNAFSEEMILNWIQALETVRDDDSIRVVIVKGNGKAFCAGGDIKAMHAGEGFFKSKEDISSTGLARKNSLWKKIQLIPLLLEEIDKPVIAQIHGFAMGAGLDMA
ncbi:MAG TPA: enoyl-CoA hydratase/isomerase family protein, partial [Bacillus bacterium]|nr:enoyl-CoA hydratase/isomerase family protein [Bacillus sp. (in: firmicutes)]